MICYVSTKMLFHYQLFICTTQTSMSCRSADLYIIKMNHKIKATADRCRHHIFKCFDWHVTTIAIVLLSLLSFLLFSPVLLLLFSLFVFCVHPLWPQLAFAYLIRLLWGFDSITSCHCSGAHHWNNNNSSTTWLPAPNDETTRGKQKQAPDLQMLTLEAVCCVEVFVK